MQLLKNEFYNKALKVIPELYSTPLQVQTLLTRADIPVHTVNLNGSADSMWDSAFSYAMKDVGKTDAIIARINEDYPGNKDVKSLQAMLTDGSAFVTQGVYGKYMYTFGPEEKRQILLITDPEDTTAIKGLFSQLRIIPMSLPVTIANMNQVAVGGNREDDQLVLVGKSCIVLLLLTSNFFVNEDNNCLELAFAAKEMGKRVIPVLIKECLYKRIKFLEGIVPLPRNGSFISSAENKDQAEYNVSEEIYQYVKKVIDEKLCL